jgi:pilus assembly protein TadC
MTTGLVWMLAGVVLVVVGVALLVSPWAFVAGGVIVTGVGMFVDFERGPQRGKRR